MGTMTSFKRRPYANQLLISTSIALSATFSLPAYAADSDVSELKRELAEQRKLIDKLLAERGNTASAPSSAAPKAPTDASAIEVSFYGVADVGVGSISSGAGRKTYVNGGGGMTASRLGAKVSKEVNEGLKAIVVAEAGIHLDTGLVGNGTETFGLNQNASSSAQNTTGNQIFARQIFAGFDTDYGKLTVGRQYSSSYIIAVSTGSVYGDAFLAPLALYLPAIGGMPTRVNNSILYSSPKFGGFSTTLLATSGTENNVSTPTVTATGATTSTNDKAGSGWELGFFYSVGKLNAGATTWSLKNSTWTTATENGLADKHGYQIGANYDFGFAKVSGDYVAGKIEGGRYENVTKTLSEATGYGLGISIPYQKHTVVARYTVLNDKSILNKDAKIYGLSYFYELKKDIRLYSSWGLINNNSAASYNLGDAGNILGKTIRAGEKPNGITIGANLTF